MKTKFDGPESAHSLGGKAAASNMTAKQRSERARKAVNARRWRAVLKKAA